MLFIPLLTFISSYLFYKAYKNTSDIQMRTIQVKTTQSGDPAKDTSISILQLSDLHLEHISITPEQLAEKLGGKKIDLIALTGDFLDRKRSIPKLEPYLAVLKQVNAPLGIYAVLGNHDYVLKPKDLKELTCLLESYGCHVLQNEKRTVHVHGKTIQIIGIDDYSTGRSDLAKAFQHPTNGINIVLTHDPNVVLDMEDYHFAYLMAGHFHGGQICYPKAYHLVKMGKLARKNVIKGLHYFQQKPFYISEGLGQTGINIRIGSRPEITFHELSI